MGKGQVIRLKGVSSLTAKWRRCHHFSRLIKRRVSWKIGKWRSFGPKALPLFIYFQKWSCNITGKKRLRTVKQLFSTSFLLKMKRNWRGKLTWVSPPHSSVARHHHAELALLIMAFLSSFVGHIVASSCTEFGRWNEPPALHNKPFCPQCTACHISTLQYVAFQNMKSHIKIIIATILKLNKNFGGSMVAKLKFMLQKMDRKLGFFHHLFAYLSVLFFWD